MFPLISFRAMMALACICLALLTGLGPAARAADTPEGHTLERSDRPVVIAADGAAKVAITISPDASDDLRATADRLQAHLQEITTGNFQVVESPNSSGITLGTLAQFPDSALEPRLAGQGDFDAVEAYAIRTDDNVVRLLGNTDKGVSHAVYRFLELIGYRQYFMGPVWEITPEKPNLTFNLNEISRPAIWSRTIGFTRMRMTPDNEDDPDRRTLYAQWKRANRIDQSFDINTIHAWHAIPEAFKGDGYPLKAEFEANPDYFALVDGKRRGPQFCVTNTGLQDIVTRYAQRYFEVHPDRDMVSLDPADTSGWCECPDCTALGDNSAQAFYLANIVAKRLQASYPGKYVGLLAYSWHSDPPQFQLEPNVFVMLTAGLNASRYSFDELFKMWSSKCERLGVYEYYTYWEADKCMLPGSGPHNSYDDYPARVQRYADNNVVALTGQAALSFGNHGLGYYLASKLLWDPKADVDRLIADFCERAFGPAAPAMRRFYNGLNRSNHPLRGIAMLRDAALHLQEAHKLAEEHPTVRARIDDLRAYTVYNYLGLQVRTTGDTDAKQQAVLDWFTWSYRTRNNYMTDWFSFRAANGNHNYHRTYAAEFDEPSWNYRETNDNPWRDDTPVTADELDRRMQRMLDEWGPAPDIASRGFSDDIVLVRTDTGGKRDRSLWLINQATLLLASLDGEPLRFDLHSFPSPNFERQPARLWLHALDGEQLDYRELSAGDNDVELPVPHAGVYQITAKRGGRGWKIFMPETLPGAVLGRRDLDTRPNYMTGYVYVPQGTRRIGVHARRGSFEMIAPDGEQMFKGQLEGDIVAIDVPEGADGRVWTIRGKTRKLWFLNIPNIVSVDPGKVFVPREVAATDQLDVVIPAQ
ncbi:MAG: DUF4838 domain-containing protein [bacterium]